MFFEGKDNWQPMVPAMWLLLEMQLLLKMQPLDWEMLVRFDQKPSWMWPNFPKSISWVPHVRGRPQTMTRLSPLVFCMWWFVVMPCSLKSSQWWGWHILLGRSTNSHADSTNVLKINVKGIITTISPLLLRGKTSNRQWCLPCDCCWKCNFMLKMQPLGCEMLVRFDQEPSWMWPNFPKLFSSAGTC